MWIYGFDGRIYEWLNMALTFGKEEIFKHELVEFLNIKPGNRILDWGCGTGLSMKIVIPHLQGNGEIVAVDVSPKMMKRAVQRGQPSENLRFQFILRKGFDLKLPVLADIAIAAYALSTLPTDEFDKAFYELWRNLRSNGKLLIVDQYIPKTKSLMERMYYQAGQLLSSTLFSTNFSEEILQIADQYFKRIDIQYRKGLMVYGYIGEKRDQRVV